MSPLRAITRFAQEPAPSYVFELSEAGIAYSIGGKRGFEALPAGTLQPSPVEDNLRVPNVAADAIQRIAPANGSGKKRRPAAIILPDHAVRVSLLDFDSFPSSTEERLALVRFRVKKAIPFDIDSASVSYSARPTSKDGKKGADVIAVSVAFEILARYEALFRGAGFQPGEVTASSLAALELHRDPGVAVIAKLAGATLTVMVLDDGQLKLFRCLPVEDASDEELLSVLQPTFAYVEDELGRSVGKLVTCGLTQAPAGLRVPVEVLRSRLGPVNGSIAGLLGYLEAA
jgi:type IV pilus assembly protein PilM